MTKAKAKHDFWHSREGYLIEFVAAWLITYAIASRAIQTGSLQQYFLTFLFFGIGINRIIKLFHK